MKLKKEEKKKRDRNGMGAPENAAFLARSLVITLILPFQASRVANLSRFRVKFRGLANRLYVSSEEATQRGCR
jgi:hypothetical protein